MTLTDERKRHILTFHPDVRPYVRYFAITLSNSERVVPSVHDSTVVIFYRLLPKPKKWLAIVVKTGEKPFILTAYLAKKPRKVIL